MAVGAALSIAAAGPAQAMHDSIPNPDNTDHGWKGYHDDPSVDQSVIWGKNELHNSTDLFLTAGSGYDLRIYDGNYVYSDGSVVTWYAAVDCIVGHWSGTPNICDVFRMRYNLIALERVETDDQWKAIGCHEFGHTGGIHHRDSGNDQAPYSCMRNADSATGEVHEHTELDSHDINEINADV